MPVFTEIPGIPSGYEELTPTSATTFTTTKVQPTSGSYAGIRAVSALVTVENHPIRFTLNGTVPTATVGHIMHDGDSILIQGRTAVALFQCIDVLSPSSVKVTYFHPLDSDGVQSGP